MDRMFIRVVTRPESIICINPYQLVSFHIELQATCKAKDKEDYKADVLRLYFVGGTALRYEVGRELTEQEFTFAVELLHRWVYKTDEEIKFLKLQQEQAELEKWNKEMSDDPIDPVKENDERVGDNKEV